jgi:F0F1-type ATP synthase assembly protein I
VSEQTRRGRRLALKFAVLQLACSGLAAVACLALSGFNAARSAVAGGVIIAVGTLVFAWRAFATGWPASSAAQGLYRGELFKWLWVVGALWLAFTSGGFAPLPLLVGLIAGQFGFWLAIGVYRQK